MGKEGVVVDFHKISVGLVDDWNLTPAQWAFIDRDPSMGNQTQLVLERYTGQKLGLAPWAAVYDCANKGYKVGIGIFILFLYFCLAHQFFLMFSEMTALGRILLTLFKLSYVCIPARY